MPAPTTEPKPPKTRKPRAPSEYIIQQDQSNNSEAIWVELENTDGPFDDTGAAIAYLKSQNMEGTFRILAVKKILTLKAETVKKMRVV